MPRSQAWSFGLRPMQWTVQVPFASGDICRTKRLRRQLVASIRRLGWSQTLEIIKYLICHFFVIFLSFAIAVCTCWVVIFLSLFCHYFVIILSFFCLFFAVFRKTVSFFDDFVGGM